MKNKKKAANKAKGSKKAVPVRRDSYDIFMYAAGILFLLWGYIVSKAYFKSIYFHPFDFRALRLVFSTAMFNTGSGPGILRILFEHIYGIAVTLLFFISAYVLGGKLWHILTFDDEGETRSIENIIFKTALGIVGIILFTLAIGLAGFLYPAVIWGFIAVFLIWGVYDLRKIRGLTASKNNKTSYTYKTTALIAIVAAVIINLIGALAPETFYDSLTYNVGLSQNWINHHRIFSSEYIMQSYFPLNITVLYTVGIILKDVVVAKLIVFFLGLGTAVSVFQFCRKYINRETGIVAAMMLYTVPIVMFCSWKTAIEVGLGFFEFLALYSFINWTANNENKWLCLSGIFAGVSLGSKYTAFFTAVAIGFLIIGKILIMDKSKITEVIKKLGMFAGFAVLITCVWYIKNLIVAGDPFYPLWFKLTHQFTNPDTNILRFNITDITVFPWLWKYTMGAVQKETFISPVFLMILPLLVLKLAFRSQKTDNSIKFLLVYVLIFVIFWRFVAQAYSRFLIPAFAALSIISAYYLLQVLRGAVIKRVAVIAIMLISLGNVYYSSWMQKSTMDSLGYILGLQSKKEYLSINRSSYPNPYYQLAGWIDENLDKDAKILLLGELRVFYIKRKIVSNTILTNTGKDSPLITYCQPEQGVRSANDLYARFKKEGITHILLNVREARRLAGYDLLNWKGKDLEVFFAFWHKHVRLLHYAVADVTLNNGARGSSSPEFWKEFAGNPYNYVYIYEIIHEGDEQMSQPPPYNFFLDQSIYPEKQWELIKPAVESIIRKYS